MCAVLNNQGGFYMRMAYIEEIRRMNFRLIPPDINFSNRSFTCENGAIRTGLSPVFELSNRTIDSILQARKTKPFSDLFDFIQRTRAGAKEAEHLIKAGALASIHHSAPQLLLLTKIYYKNQRKSALTKYIAADTVLQPFNDFQKIINEMEMLDFAVTNHPLTLFKDHIPLQNMTSSTKFESHKNKRIKFCGWLVTSRRVHTSNNQYMKFLTLEDQFGLCEAVLFPAVYAKYGHLIRSHGPYIVSGRVQSRLPGEANLIVEKLELVEMNKQEIESLLQKKQVKMYESVQHSAIPTGTACAAARSATGLLIRAYS
jgi:DNA polymerase III alpha subunit